MGPDESGQPGGSGTGQGADDRLPIATPAQALSHLRAELRRRPVLLTGVVITSIVAAAASMVAVLLLGSIIDAVRDGSDRTMLVTVAIAAGVAAVVSAVGTAASEAMLATLIARLLAALREQVVAAVLSLPVARIEQAGRGDTLSRVGTDVAVLVAGSRTAIPAIFSASVLVAVSVGGLFSLDWRLALAGLVAGPAYVMAMRWYLPRSAPKYRAQRAAEADHVQRVLAGIEGLTTVRAYGLTARQRSEIDEAAGTVRDVSISAFSVLERFVSRENRAEFIGLTSVLVVGWLLLQADAVSLGQVAAATLLFHRLFNPIGAILNFFDEAQRSGAALTRIVGVIGILGPDKRPHTLTPVRRATGVRVRALTHTYGTGAPVVDGVDLDIAAGTTLALVGASGAGKSTIASLIAGTLRHPIAEPDGGNGGSNGGGGGRSAGTIAYDDLDIAGLDDDTIRAYTSVATQDSYVLAGTLAENLRLADDMADDDALWTALRRVGAHDWARALPDGLGTAVGVDGVALDPMKGQQIALARLLLRDTPIVVLDESTAESGSRGAQVLEAAAAEVIAGRTALIVAHRLTQAAAADAIAVLEAGRIVEYGPHDALLRAEGPYAHMWRAYIGADPDIEDSSTEGPRIREEAT